MAIGKREHDLFAEMVRGVAWAEFQRIATERINEKLHKLRHIRTGGPGGYEKTNSLIDGMELMKDLVKTELAEYERSLENQDETGPEENAQ